MHIYYGRVVTVLAVTVIVVPTHGCRCIRYYNGVDPSLRTCVSMIALCT